MALVIAGAVAVLVIAAYKSEKGRKYLLGAALLGMGGCTAAYFVSGGYADNIANQEAKEDRAWTKHLDYYAEVGALERFECPRRPWSTRTEPKNWNDSPEEGVWGTGIYSQASYVCWAAVHSGEAPNGRFRVMVRVVNSPESFSGSTQNGVTTMDWTPAPHELTVPAYEIFSVTGY